MQLKLNRRLNIILLTFMALTIGAIVFLILNSELWKDKLVLVIVIYTIISLLFFMWFKYYELNIDRKIINKMVLNGDIALAEIKKATFEKIIKDSSNRKYPVWNLEVELYDKDLNKITTTVIDKFNHEQTKVPHGFIYVTYNKDKEDYKFVIPNILLQIYDGAGALIKKYEDNIKDIRYLNVYYKEGINIETFKKSIRKAKEVEI